MSFMTKKVTLHFVCPVTRQLQVSGYYKGVVALHAHKLEHCLFGYTIDVYANWQLFTLNMISTRTLTVYQKLASLATRYSAASFCLSRLQVVLWLFYCGVL